MYNYIGVSVCSDETMNHRTSCIIANLQSDESHMNSKPYTPPRFTAAFDSEELQHLSYCCQHLDSATELYHRKAIFPFFLAYIYVASLLTALTHRCTSL